MGLLDWLRGERRTTEARVPSPSVEERVEARREEGPAGEVAPPPAEGIGETPLDRRNEEAARHSGM